MKIYVAGRFQSYRKVRGVIDLLKAQGHEITCDWTRTDEFDEHGDPRYAATAPLAPDAPRDSLRMRKYAEADIRGVQEAEIFILCADDNMAGAWVEMGIALERGTPIIAIKPERYTIFLDCANVSIIDNYDVVVETVEVLRDLMRNGVKRIWL